MKFISRILLLSLMCVKAFAQNDTLIAVLDVLLAHPQIESRVYFDYRSNETPFFNDLKEGRYALILPDSNFQTKYPGIIEDLSVSWATKRMFFSVPLIHKNNRSVLVTSHIMDTNMQLFIIFDKLVFSGNAAVVEFHTTSRGERKAMIDNYIQVRSTLQYSRDRWRIRHLSVEKIKCCDNYFF